LSPLKGMSLVSLDLAATRVRDLSPLKGMPLLALNVLSDGIQDLSPLETTKLTVITMPPKVTRGMDALRRIKSLAKVIVVFSGEYPVEEFWKKYDAGEFKQFKN